MSLFRRSEVDRKLKRGQAVTMQEIVATYTKYVRMPPGGQLTPTPESMRKTLEKVAYAESLGLLRREDRESARPESEARDAAIQELAGETIEAEAVIRDVGPLTPGGADAYVVASANTLAWALVDHPDAVGSMQFAQVTEVQGAGGRLSLTEQDAVFAASLNDPTNPLGETDASFVFPDSDAGHALYSKISERLRALSPAFGEGHDEEEGIARLLAVEHQAVESWELCPVCESQIGRRVEHGVECSSCGHCFTDPNYEPVPDDSAPGISLGGTKPWRPLFETQIEYRDRMLIWVSRPIGQAIGPPYLMSHLLDAMRQS